MNTISRSSLLRSLVATALSLCTAAALAGATAPATSVGPPGKAKAPNATAPAVRQSPYARAVRENAAAENAALAQMQANGQPVPAHAARGPGQVPSASKGGRGHGSHR